MNKRRLLTFIALALSCSFLLVYGTTYLLAMNSDAFHSAKAFVANAPVVVQVLGPPSTIRLSLIGAQVTLSPSSGHAAFRIVVKGQKRNGIVYAIVRRQNGSWHVTDANLVADGLPTVHIGP